MLAQKWRDIPIQCLSDIMTTSGHGQNIVTGRADMRCRKGNLPSEGMKIFSRVYSGGANRPKMVTQPQPNQFSKNILIWSKMTYYEGGKSNFFQSEAI